MTELERLLASLAAEVDWPPTPHLALRRPARRRPGRRLVVAFLLSAALAVGAVLSVPSARSAILRFLHLGGVTIERVETLPSARERPLAAGLGRPVDAAAAERALGTPARLPAAAVPPQLYLSGGVVSALLATPAPVLLSEFRSGGGAALLKKVVGGSTGVEGVRVAPAAPGVWISGEEHVLLAPAAPPRLVGNVLIWQLGDITFRLEGAALDKQLALRLARQISG